MLFLDNHGSSVVVMSTITTAEQANHFSKEMFLKKFFFWSNWRLQNMMALCFSGSFTVIISFIFFKSYFIHFSILASNVFSAYFLSSWLINDHFSKLLMHLLSIIPLLSLLLWNQTLFWWKLWTVLSWNFSCVAFVQIFQLLYYQSSQLEHK